MTDPNRELRWKDAVLTVLADTGEPMHYADIADAIAERGLRNSLGATPANSVYTTLIGAAADQVQKVGKGLFALRETPSAEETDTSTNTPDDSPDDAEVAAASDADVISRSQSTDPDLPQSGMVTSFGMYWLRDAVHWTAHPELWGQETHRATPVDFSAQSGIYILYDGSRPVYAGQVGAKSEAAKLSNRLGERMFDHTRDRLATRWDRFSWFGVRPVTSSGALLEADSRQFTSREAIDAFEAVLIEVMETPLNRQGGRWAGAVEYLQTAAANR